MLLIKDGLSEKADFQDNLSVLDINDNIVFNMS